MLKSLIRGAVLLAVVSTALAALFGVVGVLVAYFRGSSYGQTAAWAMWLGGALVLLATAGSGSPAERAGGSRQVVGGRFVVGSDIPQPQSPFVLIPASLLEIGIGALIFVLT